MYLRIIGWLAIIVIGLTACNTEKTSVPSNPTPEFLTPLPEPREVDWARSYFDVHYCTDGDLPFKQ